jgi:hypothetical protein
MQFRLVFYNTKSENKYDAEYRYEYFGNRESIWYLWFTLKDSGHVEVFSLDGRKQEPEKGISGLVGYNI